MSLKDRLAARFRSGREPKRPPPPPDVIQPLRPRVSLIIYNPTLHSLGGQKLHEYLDGYEPDEMAQEYVSALHECSGGLVEYQIADRIEVATWPEKADGFRYDEETYLRCQQTMTGWHEPDAVSYESVLYEFQIPPEIEAGRIDEVWLFAFPYSGFYESTMAGPGAFWCNSPPILDTGEVSRRFHLMVFNYERALGTMLEAFGHRVEAHMERVWRKYKGEDNLWQRFTRYDKIAPGQANCGNVHFAPNSVADYDWGNPRFVPSDCEDWLNFPDFQGVVREVNCSEWGNGDMRAHHEWWLKHLPQTSGQTKGISNNWWWYIVDPNTVP